MTSRIKFNKIVRMKLWKQSYDLQQYPCQLCGVNFVNPFNFEVSHKVAITKGGSNNMRNLTILCGSCNKSMSSRSFRDCNKYFKDP